jgi:hypothetical protein
MQRACCHIVICGLLTSTSFFPNYLIIGMIFKKKKLLNKKCVLIFSKLLSEILLILIRAERDMIRYVHRSSRKVPVILVGI